jgi:hypothetical protein
VDKGKRELEAFEKHVKMVQDAVAQMKKDQQDAVDTKPAHSPDAE